MANTKEKSKTATGALIRKWTAGEKEAFVDQLLLEKADGQQAESGWKTPAWHACVERLAREFPQEAGLRKEKEHLKSEWQRLKNKWKILFELRTNGGSGFGWDERRQMVTASDQVWDEYIKAHPEAATFRTSSFPLYDQLTELNQAVTAIGANALHLAPGDSEAEDELDELDEDDITPTSRKRRAASPSAPAPKRVRASGTQGFLAMAEAVKDLSEVMASTTSASLGVSAMTSPQRHRQAIQLVEKETAFSDEELVAAIDLFTREQAIGDSYVAITRPNLRTLWLRKKLVEHLAPVHASSPFLSLHSSPLPDFSPYTSTSFMSSEPV